MNPSVDLDEKEKADLAKAITQKFNDRPPVVAVIGLSGTGKSSTINALFGQKLTVSHTVRGTGEFEEVRMEARPKENRFGMLPFIFMDAPGLGEDLEKDPEYIEAYERNLPKCDVLLWVLSARNRALALDQLFLAKLHSHSRKVILGINQSDLVHPNDWDSRINLPSKEQEKVLAGIFEDRRFRMSRVAGRELNTVIYSAAKRWRLVELLGAIMTACDTDRRFMFDMLSHVRPDDFLQPGLSKRDEERIALKLHRVDTPAQRLLTQNDKRRIDVKLAHSEPRTVFQKFISDAKQILKIGR